jgi:SUKH-3 immunity protein
MRPALEILTQHGWSPDCRTDPTPHLKKLEQLGFTINEPAIDFLSNFGGIEVYYTHKSHHPVLGERTMYFTSIITSLTWPSFDSYGEGTIDGYCLCGLGGEDCDLRSALLVSGTGIFQVDTYEVGEAYFLNFFDALEYIFEIRGGPGMPEKALWHPSTAFQIISR